MRLGLILGLIFLGGAVFAQAPFDSLWLQQVTIPGSPALHSGACAQWDGNWFLIGGRNNGLHGFLPPLAFPASGRNEEVWRVNPSGSVESLPLSTLPVSIYEAVTTSNMQFYQQDSILYMVGGYGWNDSAATFITYPTLTAVNLGTLSSAFDGGGSITPAFRQMRDSRLAVCGAHLGKVDSTFILPWGHRFTGIYDRSDTTGFFTQDYTYAVRRFRIQDDGSALSITGYTSSVDSVNYRRRDYNLVPQVFTDGSFGYTGFTGVFMEGVNLPWLNTANMDAATDSLVPGFEQKLSQYHSAFIPLHDSLTRRMYSLFLGGMSRYFIDSATGLLAEDTLVPFVRTVSLVTRFADGSMSESALSITLPQRMGTNAFFIPDPLRQQRFHHVLALENISGPVRLGWLYGGITSPAANISDTDPALSWATPEIYEVWISHTATVGMQTSAVADPIAMTAGPNPADHSLLISLSASHAAEVSVTLLQGEGKEIAVIYKGSLTDKPLRIISPADSLAAGLYYLRLVTEGYSKTIPVIISH